MDFSVWAVVVAALIGAVVGIAGQLLATRWTIAWQRRQNLLTQRMGAYAALFASIHDLNAKPDDDARNASY